MNHENQHTPNLPTGLQRREFMAMLAGCTASLMVPHFLHGRDTRCYGLKKHEIAFIESKISLMEVGRE